MDDTVKQIIAWIIWKTILSVDWMEKPGRNSLEPEVPFFSHSNSMMQGLLWEADSDLDAQEIPCFYGILTIIPCPPNPTNPETKWARTFPNVFL
jgi:hypothetical protein